MRKLQVKQKHPGSAHPVHFMKVTQDGDDLVIRIPMSAERTESKTGKTLQVASSKGNQETNLIIDGKPVIVGVNAYIKK